MIQKNNNIIQNNQNSHLQINNDKNQDHISYKNNNNKQKNDEGVIIDQTYIENIIKNEKSFEEYENNRLNLLKIVNEKKRNIKKYSTFMS